MASGSIHLRSESYKENFDPEQDSVVQETQAQTSKMLTIPGIPGHSKFETEIYTPISLLGEGAFGKVFLGRENGTSKLYGMKLIQKEMLISKDKVGQAMMEYKVLSYPHNHPFLLSLASAFQTPEFLVLITEFLPCGDLYFHLSKCGRFSIERARFYSAELVLAMNYLHEMGFLYRDMKVENILLDSQGHIRLGDFGECRAITSLDSSEVFCGTPEYLAPEILCETYYGPPVDWWGLGVVLYEMLMGRLPFYNSNQDVLFDLIKMVEPQYPPWLPPKAVDLLIKLLKKDPSERLVGRAIMDHPFYECICWSDLLQKKVTPPFIPQLEDETDLRYFETDFTSVPVDPFFRTESPDPDKRKEEPSPFEFNKSF